MLFFKKGQDTPCATASLSANFAGVEAFDGLGNLFLAEFTGGGYLQFISIAGECNPQPAVTYTPTVRDTVANFAFNTSDQLMIDFDYSIDGSVQTYPHPMNGSLGQPLETTTLNAINGQPAFMLALSANGESIFADSGKQNVYMYHYPAGGDPYEAIKTSLELGSAAVYPASIP